VDIAVVVIELTQAGHSRGNFGVQDVTNIRAPIDMSIVQSGIGRSLFPVTREGFETRLQSKWATNCSGSRHRCVEKSDGAGGHRDAERATARSTLVSMPQTRRSLVFIPNSVCVC
jgi:hypothetical protein